MSRQDLDEVKDGLNIAGRYLRYAEDWAKNAGDKSGASKISKVRKDVEEVEKEFMKD